jgi:arylsulfatase A-like enzyme
MHRYQSLLLSTMATVFVCACGGWAAPKSNLVFILADDLGYGDLGCFGQQIIQTPCLDRMAREGMRFTEFYAGSTVCAPSRSVLMTGQHTGRTVVRGNARGPAQALRDQDVTVAEIFKDAEYCTALIGKWGLGDDVEGLRMGLPNRQGFDHFFGYLNQGAAHNYYPEYLWKNSSKHPLRNKVKRAQADVPNKGYATERVDYSHDLFTAEALRWVRENKDRPFFLYLALTIPHANNEGSRMTGDGAEVPDYGPYANRDWPNQDKGQAAMITRMDGDVGRLLDLLRGLGIAENTLVIFSSDNGHHNEARHNPDRFNPNGPLRGMKRKLYEGGIRVPTIAWWPGTVKAGAKTDHIAYFGDLMATACALSGQPVPTPNDSISFLPTLIEQAEKQQLHTYLYWEFYERAGARALRQGRWKAVRPQWSAPIELYDLSQDPGEETDLSRRYPDIAQGMSELMEQAHTPSDRWQPPRKQAPRKKTAR